MSADKPPVVTHINVPGFSLDKDSWGDVPNDKTMAAKYFLDIMNDGTPEMVDGTRRILKALWMRLAVPNDTSLSDADLGTAIGRWYREVSPKSMPPGTKVVTRG